MFVGWLPFREERAVVEAQTGGLLDDIDIDCRPGEQRGDDQRQLSCEHDRCLLLLETIFQTWTRVSALEADFQLRTATIYVTE